MCIRHYDVPSVGWSFGSGCTICSALAREQVRPLSGCLAPDETCGCNICTRQPPSLKALAFNAYFTLMLNIERFQLTRHVNFSHYRGACSSGRVDIEQLLPPEFPSITVLYTFSCCPSLPSHATCSPGQAWIAAATRQFASREEAVAAIYADKSHYWCSVCDKPLFLKSIAPCTGKMATMLLSLSN